jgi:D-sedoheptulose 7-phosphate isomerase
LKDHILNTLAQSRSALDSLINDSDQIAAIESAAKLIIAALKTGNTVYSCGNGGSMSDAMHFAEELTGRFRDDRPALSATAISDPGHISCVANDYGYEYVFSRYLEARARPGDVLLAISTSGKSANVINAAGYARNNEIGVVSLTGPRGSELGKLVDVDISTVSAPYADRIQELHIKILHILIELIERSFFPENYPGC